jgi:hypothetical protein
MRVDSEDEFDPGPVSKYYPPRIFRKMPEWARAPEFHKTCPKGIRSLLAEIYVGLQNDCPQSTAMCVRALVESLIVSTVGDKGSFTANVDAFAAAGYLSAKQVPFVQSVLEVGHATIHRSHKPDEKDLIRLIDIVETLLRLIYVHPTQSADLSMGTPKRP